MATAKLACVLLLSACSWQVETKGKPLVPQTLGTWFPNYGDNITNFLVTPESTAAAFAAVKSVGGNTVYIDVLHLDPGYPSPTWSNVTGQTWNDTDYLSYPVSLAKAAGLTVIAWFEWGTMLSPALMSAHPEWIIGNDTTFTYGDPSNSAFQDYIVNITVDAIQHAPQLDGIQFDDHLSWPASMPSTGGPSSAVRQAALTTLMGRVYRAVKAVNPRLLVSLAPNPMTYSLDVFNVPWPQWLAAGIIDDAVVQLYTWDADAFLVKLAEQTAAVPLALAPKLKAGILINNGDQINANMTAMMRAELSQAANATAPWGGQALWYSRGLVLYNTSTVAAVWANAQP